MHVPSKSNKQKNFLKNQFFVGILGRSKTKIAGSKSISQRHGSADPDPDPDPPPKCHGSATLLPTYFYLRRLRGQELALPLRLGRGGGSSHSWLSCEVARVS